MVQQITITLTQDAIDKVGPFVDSAIDEREEYLANWARSDGYTDEDFREARESIDAARQVIARIREALENAPEEQIASPAEVAYDGTDCREAYAPDMVANGWVIYSPNEAATVDGKGFWNTKQGWCLEEDAELCPAEWVGNYSLPMSLGQDRHWINLPLLKKTTEAGLCEALEIFCDSQGLPHESADDLLTLSHLNIFQSLWLEQFMRQWERACGMCD